MRQFIRYLYEYGQEQGRRRKMRNVGFVKAEQDDVQCTVHIHAKGLWRSGRESFKVYLLCGEEGMPFAVPQGEIAYMGPGLNYRLRYTDEDTGAPENYGKIAGIMLEGSDGRRFAAMWEEDAFDMGAVRLWPCDGMGTQGEGTAGEMPGELAQGETEESSEELARGETEEGSEELARGETEESQEELAQEEREERPKELVGNEETAKSPGKIPSGMSAGMKPEISEEKMAGDPEGSPEALAQKNQAQPGPRRWKATKIRRNELSILPRCEWRLANNNFLLHGYYNYHHLVLLDDGRRLKLGVPGVYHEREAKAAESFGFPDFIEAAETGLLLGEDEGSEDTQFGYWCRYVKRPLM